MAAWHLLGPFGPLRVSIHPPVHPSRPVPFYLRDSCASRSFALWSHSVRKAKHESTAVSAGRLPLS